MLGRTWRSESDCSIVMANCEYSHRHSTPPCAVRRVSPLPFPPLKVLQPIGRTPPYSRKIDKYHLNSPLVSYSSATQNTITRPPMEHGYPSQSSVDSEDTPPTPDELSSNSEPPSSRPSRLPSFLQDDSTTIYPYFSTWSTNYTMSNLPGPGRLLGNLFLRAGSLLERGLGKFARRVGERSDVRLQIDDLQWNALVGKRLAPKDVGKVCDELLGHARYFIHNYHDTHH